MLSSPCFLSEKRAAIMRVYVLKDQIYAAILRHSDKDFRANFSRGGKVKVVFKDQIPQKEVEAILKKIFVWHGGD